MTHFRRVIIIGVSLNKVNIMRTKYITTIRSSSRRTILYVNEKLPIIYRAEVEHTYYMSTTISRDNRFVYRKQLNKVICTVLYTYTCIYIYISALCSIRPSKIGLLSRRVYIYILRALYASSPLLVADIS